MPSLANGERWHDTTGSARPCLAGAGCALAPLFFDIFIGPDDPVGAQDAAGDDPMTPPFPFIRATFLGALALAPGLAMAQTITTPPAPTAPMAQPAIPGAVPGQAQSAPTPSLAARPAMPSRATNDQRTSKIVGADVFNEAGTSIGSVDDLILGSGGAGMTVVLSVGGFLGIGARLVTVPMSDLRYNQQTSRWMLPGATRETLTARPAFTYEPRG